LGAKGPAYQFVQDMTWTCAERYFERLKNVSISALGSREKAISALFSSAQYNMVFRKYDSYFS
jgi:hypothetical protein